MPSVPPMEAPGDLRHLADLELARSVLRGDRRAREQFVTRMHCARRFLAHRNAATGHPLAAEELEDCLQDVLLALWSKLATFEGRGSLESWAYRFCLLEFLGRLKLRGRARRQVEFDEEQPAHATEPEASDALVEERQELLLRALARLDAPAGELLRQKSFEGLTFDELAARAGESPNTIKTRYYRALERLRGLLGASEPASSAGKRA